MRQFVVSGHDVPTTPTFSLDDLASGAGRLDVCCRCVTSAFVLSHAIRENVAVHLVLDDRYTLTFDGADLRQLHPDERSTAALVRTALEQREDAIGHVPVETSPGVSLTRRGFAPTLEAVAEDATVVHLHEDGVPIVDDEPPTDPAFVLSDHREFTGDEAALLADVADRRVRVGPRALHADDAITVAHHYLDTDGYARF